MGCRDASGRCHSHAFAERVAIPLPQRIDDPIQQERFTCEAVERRQIAEMIRAD